MKGGPHEKGAILKRWRPVAESQGDVLAAINYSQEQIAYWTARRATTADRVDRIDAGARVLLWQGNLAAKRARLAELNGMAVAP